MYLDEVKITGNVVLQQWINGDLALLWEMAEFNPHRIKTSWQINIKFGIYVITSGTFSDMKFCIKKWFIGASGEMGKIERYEYIWLNTIFIRSVSACSCCSGF